MSCSFALQFPIAQDAAPAEQRHVSDEMTKQDTRTCQPQWILGESARKPEWATHGPALSPLTDFPATSGGSEPDFTGRDDRWPTSPKQTKMKAGQRPCWLTGKESARNAGDGGSIPRSRKSPGEGNGNPLQYSCLGNSMDRGVWQATVHGVTRVRHNLATTTTKMKEGR